MENGKSLKEIGREKLLKKIAEAYKAIEEARLKLKENEEKFGRIMESMERWKLTMDESEKLLSEQEEKTTKLLEELNNLQELDMKTIKKTTDKNIEYSRVSDEIAEKKIRQFGWKYCPKSEWKINVRDFSKEKIKEE